MYKFLLLFLLPLLLIAKEKEVQYINEISLLIGNSENGFQQNAERSFAYDLQFQYNEFDFPIRPEIEFIYSQDIKLYHYSALQDTRYITIMANGVYEIPYSDLLTPYIKGGVGYQSYSDVPESPDSSPLLDAGAGLKLHLTKRMALKFQVLTTLAPEYFNIIATGGISFKFGRKYQAPPPQEVCEPCETPKEPKIVYITKAPKKEFGAVNIKFNFAKSTLTEASKVSVKTYAKQLNNRDNVKREIVIIGNTDSKGSRAFNATLSLKRAHSVRQELIKNDVSAARITVDGLGELNPVADNQTSEGREKNRRVIIILK